MISSRDGPQLCRRRETRENPVATWGGESKDDGDECVCFGRPRTALVTRSKSPICSDKSLVHGVSRRAFALEKIQRTISNGIFPTGQARARPRHAPPRRGRARAPNSRKKYPHSVVSLVRGTRRFASDSIYPFFRNLGRFVSCRDRNRLGRGVGGLALAKRRETGPRLNVGALSKFQADVRGVPGISRAEISHSAEGGTR